MKGFTLIELLVVVLIIGILSAVALPQYQVAVAKSRLASYLPFMRTLQSLQEQYYLANGSYSANIRDLDVECQQYGTGAHENWCYLDKKGTVHILISDEAFVLEDAHVKGTDLYFFYRSGRAACYASDDFGNRVCKSLSGAASPSGWDGMSIYRLF